MPARSQPPSAVLRRSFTREGGAQRREDLIAATLDSIAAAGTAGATVRMIARRAGVTPGLIRHYFHTKNDLITAAYGRLMDDMTGASAAGLAQGAASAVDRLASFVVAAVSAPVVDPRSLALWAGFIQMGLQDSEMKAVHARTYLGFRDELQNLIEAALRAEGRVCDPAILRRHAIACNAVIDGLWLEGSALPEGFVPGELPAIVVTSVGAILGIALGQPAPARPATAPKQEQQP